MRAPRVQQRLSPFIIPDGTPPFIFNLFPPDGYVGAPVDTNILYSILDANSGVRLTSLSTLVDGYQVISSGVLQDGYDGYVLPSGPKGFDILIDPIVSNLPASSNVTVSVTASDIVGNQLIDSWSFDTL